MKKSICFIGLIFMILLSFGVLLTNSHKKKLISKETMAVYVNDELQDSIPKKGEFMFIKADCDTNAKGEWDDDKWGLFVSNLSQKTKCNLYFYQGKTIFNFDYTGDEQTFVAPISGTYKLETWGAQGDDWLNVAGGFGGYSVGYIVLTKYDKIYVNVDKKAKNYTGPGTAPGGGGASYIITKSGKLDSFVNASENILIVSGGGGGSEWDEGVGGSGGGFKGNPGHVGILSEKNWLSPSPPASGGSQTSGGLSTSLYGAGGSTNIYNGMFGKGGYTTGGSAGAGGGQGGDGFYGGGASDFAGGGGGGSGYIGNPLLKDKVMYCYNCEESNEESTKTISTTCNEETPTINCAKKGNGYARITLISAES